MLVVQDQLVNANPLSSPPAWASLPSLSVPGFSPSEGAAQGASGARELPDHPGKAGAAPAQPVWSSLAMAQLQPRATKTLDFAPQQQIQPHGLPGTSQMLEQSLTLPPKGRGEQTSSKLPQGQLSCPANISLWIWYPDPKLPPCPGWAMASLIPSRPWRTGGLLLQTWLPDVYQFIPAPEGPAGYWSDWSRKSPKPSG